MISRIQLALLSTAFLTLSMQCSPTPAQREEKTLGIVRFPNPWTRTTGDGSVVAFADPGGFEVRMKNGQPGKLIFAMKGALPGGAARSVYADQFYGVTLDPQLSVTTSTKDEWEQAEVLPITRQQIRVNNPETWSAPANHADEGLPYRDKVYSKTGMFWGNPAGLASPNGRWLAVFSFSSKAKPSVSRSTLDGGMPNAPRPGDLILEVFDTSADRQVHSGHSRYDDDPSILFNQAFWAGDTYLIVPLDPVNWSSTGGPACFLAILPTH